VGASSGRTIFIVIVNGQNALCEGVALRLHCPRRAQVHLTVGSTPLPQGWEVVGECLKRLLSLSYSKFSRTNCF
jgi:hypothetical protein